MAVSNSVAEGGIREQDRGVIETYPMKPVLVAATIGARRQRTVRGVVSGRHRPS
ncbi:hypothetical protein ACGF7U_07035 [Micromonospora sp. NPDC047670]|uniref:hypothetical protein n=1 Tax=Micromonospora sp. NPDC047670 TaxID=3364252 RepID=UPI003723FBC2